MATNHPLIQFFSILTLLFSGCKDCIYNPVHKVDSIHFSFNPEAAIYSIGDTIFFFSNILDTIFPSGYDENKDEISSKLSVWRYQNAFSDSVKAIDAARLFNAFIIKGKEYPMNSRLKDVNIIAFTYEYIDGNFYTKIGLIPLNTGYYSIIPGSAGIKINKEKPCEQFFTILMFNDGKNNNWMLYDLLNNSYSPPGYPREKQFTFRVNN